MATPPTFVAEYEVASWTVSTTPRTVSPTTNVGDKLVVAAVTADQLTQLTSPPTGNSLTYTLAQSIEAASSCQVYGWTAPDNTGGSGWTLSVSETGSGAPPWGFTVPRFSGSDGFGASAKTGPTSGAPSLDITTQADNSAIVVMVGDWAAVDGASRTWRTVNGTTPSAGNGFELVYARDSINYTVYIAYYPDAGTAGTKTVGLSAPGGQTYSIIAIEVKGTAAVSSPYGRLRMGPGHRQSPMSRFDLLRAYHLRKYSTAIPVSVGQSIAVGQALETDTAKFVYQGLRQTLETDTSQTLTRLKSRTIGQALETDTSQAFTRLKSRTLGQNLETDTSQAFTHSKAKAIGQNLETDTAQTFTCVKSKTLGQAVETDTAQPMIARSALGIAQETDTAQAFTHSKSRAIGQASETDTAQAMTRRKSVTLGQVSETDTSQAFTRRKSRTLGQPSETDTSQPMTKRKAKILGQNLETDTANRVFPPARVNQTSETNTSQSFTRSKSKTLGQPSETDTSQSIVHRKFKAIGQNLETDTSQQFTRVKRKSIGLVSETGTTFAVARRKSRILGQNLETDTAFDITIFGLVQYVFYFGVPYLKWQFGTPVAQMESYQKLGSGSAGWKVEVPTSQQTTGAEGSGWKFEEISQ